MTKGEIRKLGLVNNSGQKRTKNKPTNLFADRNLKNRFVPEVQELYAETWKNLDPTATISTKRTIEEALDQAREFDDSNSGIQALITGSLHLVSGALCLLQSDDSIQHIC